MLPTATTRMKGPYSMNAITHLTREQLAERIDSYLDANWETMVADIDALVRVPSIENLEAAALGQPFGPAPRHALDEALRIANRMGFSTSDVDGYIATADLVGESDTQVGIIGHVDVVPAGPGWTVEPYAVTRKDGYLLGRGVIDNKGPSILALHAMGFWKDLQDAGDATRFPYTIRMMFGANEETGMRDVKHYRRNNPDPAFLFTPDAEFPVCYGEKGLYDAIARSAPMPESQRAIVRMKGGAATNAVAGRAEAVVRADASDLPEAKGIAVEELEGGLVRIAAAGKSAHASTPELGENAILALVDYLLENVACSPAERAFLEADKAILETTDGSGAGKACEDEHFGPLTVVGGTIAIEDDRFVQTFDARYPTSTTADDITKALRRLFGQAEAECELVRDEKPFLTDPQSPAIQTLLSAYNEATGDDARPFTMGGGTYARQFPCAASFGPEKPWEGCPDWVGPIHGPDEGVSEDLLKEAFRIYALTLGKLMTVEL